MSSERASDGQRWAGVPAHRVGARAGHGGVVLRVESTGACVVVQRRIDTIEDRDDTGPDWGYLGVGAAVAIGGAVILANPGRSCDGKQLCAVDRSQSNKLLGGLLVIGGAALAVGGLSTVHHERSLHTESREGASRELPFCSQTAPRGLGVTLTLDDGTELHAVTDAQGRAHFAVDDDLWAGELRGVVRVEGADAGEVVLPRDVATRDR